MSTAAIIADASSLCPVRFQSPVSYVDPDGSVASAEEMGSGDDADEEEVEE